MEFRPEELDELSRYLRGAVARLCPRWLSDEVEDLAHGAVVRMIDLAKRRDSSEGFSRGYLERVAYSHVVDEIRRRRHELCSDGYLAAINEPPSRDPNPEQSFAQRELGRAIWSCLGKLTRDRRHAVVLMLMGNRNRDIAEITGWDDKQAENYVTRGRENLRDCLRRLGYGA